MESFGSFGAEIKSFDDKTGEVIAYGSVFDVKDLHDDIVRPGAFAKSVSQVMPKMLMHHDRTKIAGVWNDAKEDSTGLLLKGTVMESLIHGKEGLALLRAKAIDTLSIGFQTVKATIDQKTGIREIFEVILKEVSFVTFGALPIAKVLSVKDSGLTERDVERALRSAGLPDMATKQLLSGGWGAVHSGARRDGSAELKEISSLFDGATALIRGDT